MYKRKIILFVTFVLIWSKAYVQVQECTKYLIPKKHLGGQSIKVISGEWASSGAQIFPLDIPPERQYDVTAPEYGISNDMQPCGQKILDMINTISPSSTDPAMFYFPPGAYLIDKPLVLNGGVVLKGAGGEGELPGQTHFHFDLSADYAHPCINISGNNNGVEDIYIVDDTECDIEIISTPKAISALYPLLTYEVINAVEMETSIFGVCSGNGVINGNKGTFKCNGIEPGEYDVTTTFSNSYDTKTVNHKIKVYSKDNISIEESNIKEQVNNDTPDNLSDSVKGSFPDKFYQHTINISGSNNFIRGVESYNTRRFHIYIGNHAHNNTVSGCFIHHSVDYSDNNGRGYGVCLAGYSYQNRIEDNVFWNLRHAMLLQGDCNKNVVAYNYSNTVEAYNNFGIPYDADDLCLHGRVSTSNGPKLNLLEGNIVVRSRVDKTHDYNGPYNTFFRNQTIDFFKIRDNITWPESYRENQFAQNVVGCNMKPKGNTLSRLDKYGFRDYYDDGNNYLSLPDKYCSFYLDAEPVFFLGWIKWPFLPNEENIIPAKYRWDSHDPQWGYDEVQYTIRQGWDDYSQLCGPPNYRFDYNFWENATEHYLAMNKIEVSYINFVKNNNILLHAGNRVLLKKGTIINGNNSDILIKAGDVCGGIQNYFTKYSIYEYHNVEYEKSSAVLNSGTVDNDTVYEEMFTVFPNPVSQGEFYIKTNLTDLDGNINIFDIFGNAVNFKINKVNGKYRITINDNYPGIVFIRYMGNNFNKVVKVIIR